MHKGLSTAKPTSEDGTFVLRWSSVLREAYSGATYPSRERLTGEAIRNAVYGKNDRIWHIPRGPSADGVRALSTLLSRGFWGRRILAARALGRA